MRVIVDRVGQSNQQQQQQRQGLSNMVGNAATSHAALQLHCSTPKRLDASDRRGSQPPKDEDVRSSRYRLLDEREQVREAHEIERIVREIKTQRRPKVSSEAQQRKNTSARSSLAVSSKSRRVDESDDDGPPAYDSVYSSRTRKSASSYREVDTSSPQWSEGGDEAAFDSDEFERSNKNNAVAPQLSVAFQGQVLHELQKLKEAQRKDLEAIQKLQREKAEAERKAATLESTLRQQTQHSQGPTKVRRSRPEILEFNDTDAGDEGVAPPSEQVVSPGSPSPQYGNFTSSRLESELDYTDGEGEEASPVFSRLLIEQCDSPVFSKPKRESRPVTARQFGHSRAPSLERSSSHRPQSARSSRHVDLDSGSDNEGVSKGERRGRSARRDSARGSVTSRPSSRPRSASRDELRRSCPFYEAKMKAQQEEEERQREIQQKLDRAARATPPANLLKRQAEAQRKKQDLLRKIERERDAELSPAKRVRARDVPPTTYLATDSFATNEDREQARKERVTKRSQELLAQAELPTRMKKAHENAAKVLEEAETNATPSVTMSMSVKMRRKLQEQLAEEERRKQLMKPKPVPNFTLLQRQWEKDLSVKKSQHKPTEPQSFFSKRERESEELKARKAARKQKMAEQEEQARREEAKRQRRLVEKVKKAASVGEGPRLTKADELRMKKVQEALRQERRAKEQETMEKERRELRSKETSRRITAQVKQGEDRRKGDYAGEFVELTSVESIAKERAKKQREQFKEAVQRNKERLMQAVATKPSLMERFAMDLKREEHKKNALEAVVKQVFQKNFKDMKGILTEEEEELARDLVAADEKEDAENGDDDTDTKKKKAKKSSEDGDDASEGESGVGDDAYEDE